MCHAAFATNKTAPADRNICMFSSRNGKGQGVSLNCLWRKHTHTKTTCFILLWHYPRCFISFNVLETFICNWKQRNHWVKWVFTTGSERRTCSAALVFRHGCTAIYRPALGMTSLINLTPKGNQLFVWRDSNSSKVAWMKVSMGGFGFLIKEKPTHVGHL